MTSLSSRNLQHACQASEVFAGALLLDLPAPPSAESLQCPQPLVARSVALFDVSIEAPDMAVSGLTLDARAMLSSDTVTTEDDMTHAVFSAKMAEVGMLRRFLQQLLASKVGLLASQKLIHPWLRRRLAAHGVIALQRLSRRHIAAVQNITGADVLSNWTEEEIRVERLGAVAELEVKRHASKLSECRTRSHKVILPLVSVRGKMRCLGDERQFLHLRSPSDDELAALATSIVKGRGPAVDLVATWKSRRRAISTLVIRGPDAQTREEAKAVLEGCIRVLTHALAEPYVLRGAGVWEVRSCSWIVVV